MPKDIIFCIFDKIFFMGEYYSTANDEQYINLEKRPPLFKPIIAYADDTNSLNLLNDKYYQFRYRYIYDDYQIGICSPISILSIPDQTLNKNNRIDVTFDTGHKTVTKIQLLRRIGNGVSETAENNTEWYIFRTLVKAELGWSDNINETIGFFGNEALSGISRIDTDKIFESTPSVADHIEVTNTNEIILGAITEGISNVNINVSFTPIYQPTHIIDNTLQVSTGNLRIKSTELPVVGDTMYLHVGVHDIFYQLQSSDLTSYPINMANKAIQIIAIFGFTYTYNNGGGLGDQGNPPRIVPASSGVNQWTILPAPVKRYLNVAMNASQTFTAQTGINFFTINNVNGIYIQGTTAFNDPSIFYFPTLSISSIVAIFTIILTAHSSVSGTNETMNVTIFKNGFIEKVFTQVVTTSSVVYTFFWAISVDSNDHFEIDVDNNGAGIFHAIQVTAGTWTLNGEVYPVLKKGFKSGSRGFFGIVYYTDYKNGGVNTNDNCIVKFDFYSERLSSQAFENAVPILGFIPSASWEIKHLPPVEAKRYQIVYKEYDPIEFVQIIALSATSPSGDNTVVTIDDFRGYDIAIGDIVELIGEVNPYKLSQSQYAILTYTVVAFNVSSKTLTISANFYFAINRPHSLAQIAVLEIRKTQTTTNDIYFEVDQVYEIGNPGLSNRFHMGKTQNQNPSDPINTPATGNIQNGGIYYRMTNGFTTPSLIESKSIVDNKESNFWDKGRTQIVTPTQRSQKYGQLRRWSNRLIQNTQVNGLSTWDEGNYDNNLNARFGDITGLRQIGFVLKSIQWGNINSTLLFRNQLANTDGSFNIVVTNRLLGTTNSSEQEYGTKHPGSVCVNGDHLFFLDTIKGKFLRDANNGTFPISDYFTKKYWRDKSSIINADPLYEVICGVDHKFNDIYVTVKRPAANRVPGSEETIYFNEDQNSWKYFVDMKTYIGDPQFIDWYGWVGQSFFTFMNGNVWQENSLVSGSTPLYLNRFGEQKSLIIETIGMLDDDKVKIFMTHEVHSNLSPTLVEIFIPATAMYPNGMYTYLKPGNYAYREGVFYANLKRDWYTKGVPVDNAAGNLQIATGRQMRGHVVRVRLTYTTTGYVKVYSTGIGMIPSEKS